MKNLTLDSGWKLEKGFYNLFFKVIEHYSPHNSADFNLFYRKELKKC